MQKYASGRRKRINLHVVSDDVAIPIFAVDNGQMETSQQKLQ